MDLLNKLRHKFNSAHMGLKLIYIHVSLFLLYLAINYFFFQFQEEKLQDYWALDFRYFLQRPWTLFTYSFCNLTFYQLFNSSVILYFLSRHFLNYFNAKILLKFYFVGTIFGGLMYLLGSQISFLHDYYNHLITPTTGMASLFGAIYAYAPQGRLTFIQFAPKIEYKYVLFLMIALLLYICISQWKLGLIIASSSSFLFGYFYMKQFELGNDFLSFSPTINSISSKKKKFRTDEAFNENRANNQKKIDKILDKVSSKGYEKLNKKEKEFLFKQK